MMVVDMLLLLKLAAALSVFLCAEGEHGVRLTELRWKSLARWVTAWVTCLLGAGIESSTQDAAPASLGITSWSRRLALLDTKLGHMLSGHYH